MATGVCACGWACTFPGCVEHHRVREQRQDLIRTQKELLQRRGGGALPAEEEGDEAGGLRHLLPDGGYVRKDHGLLLLQGVVGVEDDGQQHVDQDEEDHHQVDAEAPQTQAGRSQGSTATTDRHTHTRAHSECERGGEGKRETAPS